MIKTNTGVHKAQEEHTADNCHINDAPHNHPDTDCGHYVASGPQGQPLGPEHDGDQDPEHGPGVQQ